MFAARSVDGAADFDFNHVRGAFAVFTMESARDWHTFRKLRETCGSLHLAFVIFFAPHSPLASSCDSIVCGCVAVHSDGVKSSRYDRSERP